MDIILSQYLSSTLTTISCVFTSIYNLRLLRIVCAAFCMIVPVTFSSCPGKATLQWLAAEIHAFRQDHDMCK